MHVYRALLLSLYFQLKADRKGVTFHLFSVAFLPHFDLLVLHEFGGERANGSQHQVPDDLLGIIDKVCSCVYVTQLVRNMNLVQL